MSPTATMRFSKCSSLSAMNNDRTFSAWARCLSNLSCNVDKTAKRIFGSAPECEQS